MAQIDNLEIVLTANAEQAERAINRVAASSVKLKTAATSAGGGCRDLAAGAKESATETSKAHTETEKAEKSVKKYGKSSEESGDAAKRGSHGITAFWQQLKFLGNQIKRVAMYRAIRSVLRSITEGFKEGVQNLYQWSSAVNGQFSKSMNQLATASNYLKNSLGAMAAPLINSLAPIVDSLVDKFVMLLNSINAVFAAIEGQETYTVAKKVATSYGTVGTAATGATEAVKELKRTILGFDEINKLDKFVTGGTSGGGGGGGGNGGGIEFEEKPLEGFLKDLSDLGKGLPDWLKWLLTGTALVGGFLLIKQLINWLTGKLKDLFDLNIPDWLRWLFGPKKDGDGTGELNVDIALNTDAETLFKDFKDDWDGAKSKLYTEPYLNNTGKTVFDNFKKDWDAEKSKLYAEPYLNNTGKTVFDNFKKDWDDNKSTLYATPALNNTGKTLFNAFKKDWDDNKSTLYITPALNNTGKTLFNTLKKSWLENRSTLYITPALNSTGKTLFNTLKKSWLENRSTLYITPALNSTGKTLFNTLKKSWLENRSTLYITPALNSTGKTLFNTLKKSWDDNKSTLYITPALNSTGKTLFNTLKKSWDDNKSTLYATPSLSNTAKAIWKDFKKAWDKAKSDLKASVIVEAKGKGGAIQGGGGQTSGGGAGRGRHALGGVVTANSESWFTNIPIPRYEFGTTNAHGTLFLAGEAGPEILGHIGGRTEILNKSQLAATMYSAVRSAMRGVTLDAKFYNAGASVGSEDDYGTMYKAIYDAFTAVMARGEERDREKVALLRQLNDKDYNLEISASSINRANTRLNRRAGTTIVPVGT